MHHLDSSDVASLPMPAAVLAISGTGDGLFDIDGGKHGFARLSARDAEAGLGGRFRGRFHDAPHEVDAEMQWESWDWPRHWL